MATKTTKPSAPKKVTKMVVVGSRKRFITAAPEVIEALVDQAIAAMSK